MKMSRHSLTSATLRCLVLLLVAIITYMRSELMFGLAVASSTLLFFTGTESYLTQKKMSRAERLITDVAVLISVAMFSLTFLANAIIPTIVICAPLYVLMPIIKCRLRGESEYEA